MFLKYIGDIMPKRWLRFYYKIYLLTFPYLKKQSQIVISFLLRYNLTSSLKRLILKIKWLKE